MDATTLSRYFSSILFERLPSSRRVKHPASSRDLSNPAKTRHILPETRYIPPKTRYIPPKTRYIPPHSDSALPPSPPHPAAITICGRRSNAVLVASRLSGSVFTLYSFYLTKLNLIKGRQPVFNVVSQRIPTSHDCHIIPVLNSLLVASSC